MPRTNLGRNLSGMALAGWLVVLAGCVATPTRTAYQGNVHNAHDVGQIPVTASVTETGYPPNNAVGPGYYSPSGGPAPSTYQGGDQRTYGNLPPQGNSYAAPAPYAASATATTRYFDPNVMPVGATDVAPAGPAVASPYNGTNALPGPPPGYAGSGPSAPMMIGPASASPKKSDEDDEWDFSHLAPDYTWKKFKEAIGWGADQRLAREAYDKGQALFNAKNYDDAAKEFYTASWRWPDSTMEEDAMFLMGESYFFSDHYGSAQDSYINLLKKHDNTRYLDTVVARLFAIATYWEKLDLNSHHWPMTPNAIDKTQPWFDTFGNALACYQAVWLHDPTGPLADVALFRVANAHFRREEWEDAAENYDILRKNHPKSKYQKDAHLLELQAKLKIYQGPKYSVVSLNDAQEIAEQTLKQFPGQLGEEEGRVRGSLAMIYEQRAEREWVMAQYYDAKSEYRAAREYYKVLLEKYARTSFAERARKRIQEIQNEPDEPPNHFAWLTGLFGKGK
jgi:outer membrane protein assembly factor BamD (BamD/ComL family)